MVCRECFFFLVRISYTMSKTAFAFIYDLVMLLYSESRLSCQSVENKVTITITILLVFISLSVGINSIFVRHPWFSIFSMIFVLLSMVLILSMIWYYWSVGITIRQLSMHNDVLQGIYCTWIALVCLELGFPFWGQECIAFKLWLLWKVRPRFFFIGPFFRRL